MAFNIIESVKEEFSGDITNKIAGILGESSMNVQQALQGSIPSIFTGVLLKVESGDPQETLNLATDASRIDILHNLNSLSGGTGSSKGMDFLKIIFGERTTDLSTSISTYSGISDQSASVLLTIATPAALGALGKHILDTNMNASGLRSFLNGQRKKILNAMPTSLFLEGILGIENLSGFSEKFLGDEIPVSRPRFRKGWIWFLTAVLVAGGACWYFFNMQNSSVKTSPVVKDTVQSIMDTTTKSAVAETPFSIRLPDGTVLNAKKGSLEDQLFIFFNDPGVKPSRRYPFNFDQLIF